MQKPISQKMTKTNTIYTLTANPALDLSGVVDRIVPNEKNYVYAETRYPGGNAINVARLLTRSSIPVCATGFLGGSVGNEIRGLLDKEHVEHDFIEVRGQTRISITVSNKKTHQQTRLSFPGPKIQKKEITSLCNRISKTSQGSWLVIGGSCPPGFSTRDLNQVIHIAQSRKMHIVLDVPGSLLKTANLNGLVLIKPNLTEFQELIGKKVTSMNAIVDAAKKIAQKVRFVCVSSVNGGALLVSRDSLWFGTPPPIKIRSTVGAGDSMVAGMVAELWKTRANNGAATEGKLEPQLLRRGLAFAATTLSTEGTKLGNSKDIKKLYPKVKITQIGIDGSISNQVV